MEETTTTIATKRCSKCGRELPVTEFAKRTLSKDGLQAWCKHCTKIANAKSHSANTTPPNQLRHSTQYSQR